MNKKYKRDIIESKKHVMLSLNTLFANEFGQLTKLVDTNTKNRLILEFTNISQSIQNIINILDEWCIKNKPKYKFKYMVKLHQGFNSYTATIESNLDLSRFNKFQDKIFALIDEGVIDGDTGLRISSIEKGELNK